MMLPALLHVTHLPAGTDIQGLGISAALAASLGAREDAVLGVSLGVAGAWLLFETQLDLTRSARPRHHRHPGAPAAAGCAPGAAATSARCTQVRRGGASSRSAWPSRSSCCRSPPTSPGVVIVVASWHLLDVDMRDLPVEYRPSPARRAVLIAMSAVYGSFVLQSVRTLF